METEIENLLVWAETQGIEINGCAPKQLHGRGIGIVATRALEVKISSSPQLTHSLTHSLIPSLIL